MRPNPSDFMERKGFHVCVGAEKMQAGFSGEPAQINTVGLINELHQLWHLQRQRKDKDRTIKAEFC